MKDPNSGENPWRAVALASAIGIDLAVCMISGYWIGKRLGDWLGSPVWIVVGIMLGFAVGVFGIAILLRKFTGGSNG
jgi:putative Mn2+ efflux pump MntP